MSLLLIIDNKFKDASMKMKVLKSAKVVFTKSRGIEIYEQLGTINELSVDDENNNYK